MINVLYIVKQYSGNYPLLEGMANLDRSRFNVTVCCLTRRGDGRNALEEQGCRVIYLGYDDKKRLKPYQLGLLKKLRDVIDKENIHVVNCQRHRNTVLGVVAAFLAANRPMVISTQHGLDSVNGFKRRLAYWLMNKKLFKLVGCSKSVRNYLLKCNWRLDASNVLAVQNGLDFSKILIELEKEDAKGEILPAQRDCLWFGTVGRLTKVKNQESLIKAFALAVKSVSSSILVLVGDGELEAPLRELGAKLGVQDRVFFLGYRKDIPQILKSLDVFLLPSLREGLPLSMLEAMASGVPVIASRVGGIPEVFGDIEMGALLDEPTDVEALAREMVQLASFSSEKRTLWGQNARTRALSDFSASRMIDQYQVLYEEAYQAWVSKKHPQS